MSHSDREKWDQRYREGEYSTRKHASALLEQWLPRINVETRPPEALDVGCGLGRNALYLARRGWQVVGVDISDVALGRLEQAAAAEALPIRCVPRDLETDLIEADDPALGGPYDLAIMIRYTNLLLIESLKRILRPGGYLIVEEHLVTDAEVVGPKSARFRVPAGALRQTVQGMELLDYREGIVQDPDSRPAALAQVVARRSPAPSD